MSHHSSNRPQRLADILRPIRAMRWAYLPLLMVYFAYGALGLIDVSRDMWIKERLTLSAADLAGLGVWLSLPWTMKMVFGQLVDCFPILGSQRRAYVLIGAGLVAAGLVVLAGAAGGWIAFARPDQLYVAGAMLMVLGAVIQDVVADAMSTEVVPRVDASGNPRPEQRDPRRPRHGSGARPPRACLRHPVGRRAFRVDRAIPRPARPSSLSASWCRRSRCSGCSSSRKA